MKLRLFNFRCYEDSEFDLGTNGLTLINGPSGNGKSSLLMAIQFALFGTGTKIVSHGKTHCKVELHLDDGTLIVRTKRPNHLVVNNKLEDDEAQAFITKMFGDTFDVTSYISQNAVNSFVTMSPVDKLAFLEKYAFKDVDLPAMKARCKAVITQTNENLIQVSSQLQMARSFLDTSELPSPVTFPIKCKTSQIDLAIKNEENKTKNCVTLIKKKQKEQLQLSEKLSELTKLSTQISCYSDQLLSVDNEFEAVSAELNCLNYEGDDNLEKSKKLLAQIETHRELISLKSDIETCQAQLDTIKNKETLELKNKIDTLSSTLWNEYSKDDAIETINTLKLCKDTISAIIRLQDEKHSISPVINPEIQLEKIKKLEANISEQENTLSDIVNLYKCPNCNCSLKMQNNTLVKSELITNLTTPEQIKDQLVKLSLALKQEKKLLSDIQIKASRLNTIESKLQTIKSEWDDDLIIKIIDTGYLSCKKEISDLDEDLIYIQTYIEDNNRNQIEYDLCLQKLNDGIFSSSYNILFETLNQKKAQLQCLSSKIENIPVCDESELRKSVQDMLIRQHSFNQLKLKKSSLAQTQSDLLSKIHICKESLSGSSTESIKMKINLIKQELIELEGKLSIQNTILDQIEKYKAYIAQKHKYEELSKKVSELELSEVISKNEYAAACKLKIKIQEAEAIAISQIISSINIHAQMFIDAFFDDNPMSIQLLSFKESKKGTKPQINMEIFYKGSQCDLSSLSGGEYARVVLAFTLALSEMNNCPLVMLDECTASLDQDLTTTVLEKIKTTFSSRNVLVIAHQVVGGCFDHIITV